MNRSDTKKTVGSWKKMKSKCTLKACSELDYSSKVTDTV